MCRQGRTICHGRLAAERLGTTGGLAEGKEKEKMRKEGRKER
jgi:hypothetical protein